MPQKNPFLRKLGTYGFVMALVLSVISGIEAIMPPKAMLPGIGLPVTALISVFVFIVGLILGLYNIDEEDEVNFLTSISVLLLLVTALMVISVSINVGAVINSLGAIVKAIETEGVKGQASELIKSYDIFKGIRVSTILSNIGVLLGPAAITVSLRRIFRIIIK